MYECHFCTDEKENVEHKQICSDCEDDFASMGKQISDLKEENRRLLRRNNEVGLRLVLTDSCIERWTHGLIEGTVQLSELITLMSERAGQDDAFLRVHGFKSGPGC